MHKLRAHGRCFFCININRPNPFSVDSCHLLWQPVVLVTSHRCDGKYHVSPRLGYKWRVEVTSEVIDDSVMVLCRTDEVLVTPSYPSCCTLVSNVSNMPQSWNTPRPNMPHVRNFGDEWVIQWFVAQKLFFFLYVEYLAKIKARL